MLDDLTGLVAVMAPFMMVVGIVWIKSRNKLEEKRLAATASMSAERPRSTQATPHNSKTASGCSSGS